MNQRQAKRIALATAGAEILLGNTIACIDDNLTVADAERFEKARKELAYSWLKRAGFPGHCPSSTEILKTVLGDEYDFEFSESVPNIR